MHGVRNLISAEANGREHGITNPRVHRNTADLNDLVLLTDVADKLASKISELQMTCRTSLRNQG
jgi:hypothetical protein